MKSPPAFKGWNCAWCAGTPSEQTAYNSYHDMMRHAAQVHYTNGVPHHGTFLTPVDIPNGDPSDVTEPVAETLLLSAHNCTTDRMLMVEPPAETRSKSKKAHDYEKLLNSDGSVVLGPSGQELYDIPGLGRTVSSTVNDFFIEYLHFRNPEMAIWHVTDRQKHPVGGTAYNMARGRYREGLDKKGGTKGFIIRSPLVRSKGAIDKPLLRQLDSMNQAQWDHNTIAHVAYNRIQIDVRSRENWTQEQWDEDALPDVSKSVVTLPRPTNLHADEDWNPSPLVSFQRATPYRYTPWTNHAFKVLYQGKRRAKNLGKGHWSELTNEELGLGQYARKVTKGQNSGLTSQGKFTLQPKKTASSTPQPDTAQRGPDIEHDEFGTLPGPRKYYQYTRQQLRQMLLERGLTPRPNLLKPPLVTMLLDDDERREREELSPIEEPEVSRKRNRKRKMGHAMDNEDISQSQSPRSMDDSHSAVESSTRALTNTGGSASPRQAPLVRPYRLPASFTSMPGFSISDYQDARRAQEAADRRRGPSPMEQLEVPARNPRKRMSTRTIRSENHTHSGFGPGLRMTSPLRRLEEHRSQPETDGLWHGGLNNYRGASAGRFQSEDNDYPGTDRPAHLNQTAPVLRITYPTRRLEEHGSQPETDGLWHGGLNNYRGAFPGRSQNEANDYTGIDRPPHLNHATPPGVSPAGYGQMLRGGVLPDASHNALPYLDGSGSIQHQASRRAGTLMRRSGQGRNDDNNGAWMVGPIDPRLLAASDHFQVENQGQVPLGESFQNGNPYVENHASTNPRPSHHQLLPGMDSQMNSHQSVYGSLDSASGANITSPQPVVSQVDADGLPLDTAPVTHQQMRFL